MFCVDRQVFITPPIVFVQVVLTLPERLRPDETARSSSVISAFARAMSSVIAWPSAVDAVQAAGFFFLASAVVVMAKLKASVAAARIALICMRRIIVSLDGFTIRRVCDSSDGGETVCCSENSSEFIFAMGELLARHMADAARFAAFDL